MSSSGCCRRRACSAASRRRHIGACGTMASLASSASNARRRSTSPGWSRCSARCGGCCVGTGRYSLISVTRFSLVVHGPANLVPMLLHVATVAEDFKIRGFLIVFVPVFVVNVEPPSRLLAATTFARFTDDLSGPTRRETVIPGFRVPRQHLLTLCLPALWRPPRRDPGRHLRGCACTAPTVALAFLCLTHLRAMLGCAFVTHA